ncbi:hypothetical protein RVR_8350 [Actinacidiphila reveromycinica]|uniref:Uncharacterized protein n=1 Tax=Actinacidiphila reveromycinica TaxID=659352 RepID=A0A7U3UYE4_9ACTN|nr:hypothetical protein [Streptomyces sp. SN-593]BBB01097.1 hypothetical protein RVR_8350 [Streptomyces sp. SN-593]
MPSNNDRAFYDQRATEVQNAVQSGDIDAAARLVAHTVIEEGTDALTHLTNSLNQQQ